MVFPSAVRFGLWYPEQVHRLRKSFGLTWLIYVDSVDHPDKNDKSLIRNHTVVNQISQVVFQDLICGQIRLSTPIQ